MNFAPRHRPSCLKKVVQERSGPGRGGLQASSLYEMDPLESSIMDQLAALGSDYFDSPATHAIEFPIVETPDGSSSSSSSSFRQQLTFCLTSLIHRIDSHASANVQPRTGRPEEPLRILYRVSAETPENLSLPGSKKTDGDERGPVMELYLADFWQSSWSVSSSGILPSPVAQRMICSGGKCHPQRPVKPRPGTTVYARDLPSLGQRFSLVVVDLDAAASSSSSSRDHLACFSAWHNTDRVNQFWGERGDLDHHRNYLARQEADPHTLAVIGYWDETPSAYFELYHAKEDALSEFCRAGDYDRGYHVVIGHEAFRGPHRVRAWISSLTHYLFLADPRTQRVLLEPRVDNVKFIRYLVQNGYSVEKEFNFPHKRAALVSITREKFFEVQGVAT